MEEVKLHLGCGKVVLDGYVNIDIVPLNDKVVKGDVRNLSDYEDCSVDEILACDLIEHFPIREVVGVVLKEWTRVLKPGGKMTLKCPDVEVIFEMFYKQAKAGNITWGRLSEIIHGHHKDEFNVHHVTFHFDWLKEILEGFGMRDVVRVRRVNMCMLITCVKGGMD